MPNKELKPYKTPGIKSQGRFIAHDPIEMRILDVIGSALLILAFAPLMVFIALAIIITDPGPALFKQRRIGKNGKPFDCYKFRTMVIDAEDRLDALLASDPAARAEWERDQKLRRDPRVVPCVMASISHSTARFALELRASGKSAAAMMSATGGALHST